jgi:acetyl-CoA/propionyl-CoA carboxylase, biotin carboxylase, biotin carboxyl carrier protein
VDGKRITLGLPARLLAGLQGASGAGGALRPGALADNGDDGALVDDGDDGGGSGAPANPAELRAAMSGSVVKWLVPAGEQVQAGDPILVLEAMKMETTVTAHRGGVVGEHLVVAGEAVAAQAVLTTIG